MRKFIQITAVILLCTASFFILLWLYPSLILNDSLLGYASKIANKQGVLIKWERASLAVKSIEWNLKQVNFSGKGFTISIPKENFEGSFSKIDLTFQFGIKQFKPKIISVGPVNIQSQSIAIKSKQETNTNTNAKKQNKKLPFLFSSFELPSFLNELHPHNVHLSLENITFNSEWLGNILLGANESKEGTRYQLQAKAKPVMQKEKTTLELNLELVKPFTLNTHNWESTATFTAHLGKGNLVSSFKAKGTPHRIDGDLSLKSNHLTAPLDKIIFSQCPISWTNGDKDNIKFTCEISGGPSLSQLTTGKLDLNIALTNLGYKFDSQLTFSNFNKIVRILENTSWAVPQPFNTLHGTILASFNGDGTIDSAQSEFPFQIETRLFSKNQKLNAILDNTFKISQLANKTKYSLETKAVLKEVVLVLPPLDTSLPPQILPDDRMLTSKAPPQNVNDTFDFSFSAKTGDLPIYLISKTSNLKVPVRLKLESQANESLNGKINFLPFEVNLFKRNAKVEYLKLVLHDNHEQNEIRSEIKIFYTDYTISIYVNGLLSQPEVQLTSTPPLPEKQLVAVLLFGKSIDQLDSDQVSSVGNTQAAITEGVIGIASLYALASTPIESVGYDPSSRVFSAKIRLQDGTSMNIGTDMTTVKKLGVRKRLGTNWFMNTYLENPFQSSQRSATGLLEWSRRF